MQLEEFFNLEPYRLNNKEKSELLYEIVKKEIDFHYENNSQYRKFCEKKGYSPNDSDKNIENFPFIPVQVFKSLGHKLHSVPLEEISLKLHSSATSGIPSTILVDKTTAKRQARIMTKVISDFIGKVKLPMIIFDLDIFKSDPNEIGARGSAIKAYLNFSSKSEFVLENVDGNLIFNENKFEKILNELNNDEPVTLFGFTYVLYDSLKKLNGKVFKLPPGSKIIHIGGWKKLENQKISKEDFNRNLSNLFQISEIDVIDIYGFTEHLGLNYPDCKAGWKHAPIFSEVVVRDAKGQKIENGEIGRLQFLSPLPHSYPGNSLITDDVGFIDTDQKEQCSCGRYGRRFKIVGRAKKAEIRGCGDIMSEKLTENKEELSFHTEKSNLDILFHNYPLAEDMDDADKIKRINEDLLMHKDWLYKQPTEALIGLISEAAKKWQHKDFELYGFRENGLGFLINWCSPQNLRNLIEQGLNGNSHSLDSFCNIPGYLNRKIRTVPKGLVVHWLSGNVPVLGMLVLVQSIISKNLNILKAASQYTNTIPILLRSFKDISYTTPGGYKIEGADLLKTISVVHYHHDDYETAKSLSHCGDVRIAWGSSDAIHHVQGLPKKWDSQDIMFGPKLSFMVIGKEALSSERKLRKVLRRAATDCSVFDQTACASPHTIFLEKNDFISGKEFSNLLSEQMEKAVLRIPVEEKTQDMDDEISTIRAVYDFIGHVWSSENSDWTVLYDEEKGLARPTYSRVITVRMVDSIFDSLEYIHSDIQSIGLAANKEEKILYAEKAASLGVDRCPDIGFMTNFEMPWDGVHVIDRLTKKVTLGGPY